MFRKIVRNGEVRCMAKTDFMTVNRPPPVETILGVWEFSRRPHFDTLVQAPPGHILHLMLEGDYSLEVEGRKHAVRTGDLIYYQGGETVRAIGGDSPVRFLSVAFLAKALPPIPHDRRILRASKRLRDDFAELHNQWRRRGDGPAFVEYARLCDIVREALRLAHTDSTGETTGAADDEWARVEETVRLEHLHRIPLHEIYRRFGTTRGRLERACLKSCGKPPLIRLRELRMAEARGLLAYSDYDISRIAEHLGYPRLHEFSREFSHLHKQPPTAFRDAARKQGTP
jgi:AraC-like DNA-binding protein